MVDVSYQMILSTLQTVGLLVGIYYYVMTLRNQQRNQETIYETRQLQYLLEWNKDKIERTYSNIKQYENAMTAEWTDFSDYLKKYGPDTEHFNYRMNVWGNYHVTGLMSRDGLIDVKSYMEYIGDGPVMMWRKYRDIIMEYRRRFNNPVLYLGWEILAEEIDEYRISQGWGSAGGPRTTEELSNMKPETNR